MQKATNSHYLSGMKYVGISRTTGKYIGKLLQVRTPQELKDRKVCYACNRGTNHPTNIEFKRWHQYDKEYKVMTGFMCKKCGHLQAEYE